MFPSCSTETDTGYYYENGNRDCKDNLFVLLQIGPFLFSHHPIINK